jgi:hypothetical protein
VEQKAILNNMFTEELITSHLSKNLEKVREQQTFWEEEVSIERKNRCKDTEAGVILYVQILQGY